LSTARSQGEAIARALRQCQSKAGPVSDCGAELLTYRSGWSVAVLCGPDRILSAADTLEEAETLVYRRIQALKEVRELAPCRHLLTVDPVGIVTAARRPVAQR
jgi:hypothetical protein